MLTFVLLLSGRGREEAKEGDRASFVDFRAVGEMSLKMLHIYMYPANE